MKIVLTLALLFAGFCFLPGTGYGQIAYQSIPQGFGNRTLEIAIGPQNIHYSAGVFWQAGSISQQSVLVAQDSAGNFLWEAPTDSSWISGNSVCTDPAGNVYLSGYFQNGAQLLGGAPAFPASQSSGIFIAKYDPTGNLLWAQPYNTTTNSTNLHLNKLRCDSNGDLYILGQTDSAFSFGPNMMADSGSFVLKMNTSGQAVWLESGGYTINDLAIDVLGNPLICGYFNDVLTIGNQSLVSPGRTPFLAKLSGAASTQWIKAPTIYSGSNYFQSSYISTDATGNYYLAGSFGNAITFDSTTVTSPALSSGYVACFSSSGNLNWLRALNTNPSGVVFVNTIVTDNSGFSTIGGMLTGTATIGNTTLYDTNGGWQGDALLARLDPAGNIIWAISGGSPNEEQILGITLFGSNHAYVYGISIEWVPSAFPIGSFVFGGLQDSVGNGFLYKFLVLNEVNRIAGQVFYDLNGNGLADAGEPRAQHQVLQVGQQLTGTGITGRYEILTDTGTHTISFPLPPLYYTLVPGSYSVNLPAYGVADTTSHFALQPTPGMQDLQVTLTATTVPRPGFDYPLLLTYRNLGTTILNGSVELQLDSLLLFQNSTPAQTSVTGNTLTWNFTNLQPTQSATIVVYTEVPATAILGTTIHQTASIFPLAGDLTPADNISTDSAIVVGAYDPNDKQVNHTSLTPTQVANEEWLEYTIRFQNTGTDTAFTVRIADTLSALLNIPTIELLASSHAYTWNIKGAGIMEWRFDNILLPDSNTNEAASHGFVKYRIKPKANLVLGDVIENTAHIYFDFNEAIITNTTTTEVKLPSSVASLDFNPLRIYPNPSKGHFTVQCNNIRASQLQAEMLNVLGQVVWQQNLPVENGNLQQVVRTSGLSKGVYYLQVRTEKEAKVQKVVLE